MRSQILLCTICLVVVLLLAVTGCVFIAPELFNVDRSE